MKSAEIDTTDIPPAFDWRRAVTGKFYRPEQKLVPIQLDSDVLAWLKGQGADYQTRINALLRESMERTKPSKSVIRISDYGEFAA